MRLEPALATELAACPKHLIAGPWIASFDGAGIENGRKLAGGFNGAHPEVGRLRFDASFYPPRKVSVQVSLMFPGHRTRLPLYRIDLWPGRYHNNPQRDGDPDSRRRFTPFEGHVHDFADCVDHERPDDFARALPDGVVDLETAMAHLGSRFTLYSPMLPTLESQGILL